MGVGQSTKRKEGRRDRWRGITFWSWHVSLAISNVILPHPLLCDFGRHDELRDPRGRPSRKKWIRGDQRKDALTTSPDGHPSAFIEASHL